MSHENILELFERLTLLEKANERAIAQAHSLQAVQLVALHYLARCNRFSDTPAAVTEYLSATKGTVSQSLIQLEKKGMVTKVQDPEDKRVSHLKLTSLGRSLVKQTNQLALLDQALGGLDCEEKAALESLLRKTLIELQNTHKHAMFGPCSQCKHLQKSKGGHLCGLTKEPLYESDLVQICREYTHP
ncbi:MAG: winged helix DNA-binding protein [Gammaproteobacteria bacterium]|nr:winged helix DNA-binding protein [Gammaproteobacteria bacterium]MDH5692671.1 winged helix DNA-binding protein [Gammaproteobacteria bacterium]